MGLTLNNESVIALKTIIFGVGCCNTVLYIIGRTSVFDTCCGRSPYNLSHSFLLSQRFFSPLAHNSSSG